MADKLTLYGFNNLTKTLSFNIYDICYAKTPKEQQEYIQYIDEQYNSERLTNILCDVTKMIGAQILNISKQDYDPQGASVNVLLADTHIETAHIDESCNRGVYANIAPDMIHAHLDKSHVTVHTFPEYHPDNAISTFRVDIDVATCGEISPLKALNHLIGSFDSDIITIDYIPWGFIKYADNTLRQHRDIIRCNGRFNIKGVDENIYRCVSVSTSYDGQLSQRVILQEE